LRPRAGRATVIGLFVRSTQTRSRLSGEPYFTHSLLRTERVGGRVKPITLLHLGRHFDWPLFCSRLRDVGAG
jgi:hypothetical protein